MLVEDMGQTYVAEPDQVAVDGVHILADQVRIKPTPVGLVFFGSCLVCLFVTPNGSRRVSGAPNDVFQHARSPRRGLQSIAKAPQRACNAVCR
jgi:hypothetical protein